MVEMKQKLIVYGIRIVIWILEKAITKITTPKDKDSEKILQEDVKINPETAKLFSKFIKKHTVGGTNENS